MAVQGLMRFSVTVAVLVLTACTTTPERGEPYSPPQYAEPDSQCRDIVGSYNARPHPLSSEERETRPLLAMTLLSPHPRLDQSQRVELKRGKDGSWQVLALGGDGALLSKQRYGADSGVFLCDDGQLHFHSDKVDARPEGIPWETLVLRKTTDGSLMVRKGGLFSGLVFMVFPLSLSTDDWYLFKPSS